MSPAPVVAQWTVTPDIHFECLTIDGEDSDDEDNIAYQQLAVSTLTHSHNPLTTPPEHVDM